MTFGYIRPKKTKMSRKQVDELAKMKVIHCRPPILGRITYTAEDWYVLAKVLRTTTTLQKLAFSGLKTLVALQNDEVVDALAKNRSVKILRIDAHSWSYFDEDNDKEALKALAAVLKENSTIKEIDIEFRYRNQMGAQGARALAAVLKVNSSLQSLYLRGNEISAEGAAVLAAALKDNKSLQTVVLSDNYIGDEGAKALADALKENITLKTLRLARNKIGEKGGKAILNALQQGGSSSIESIVLWGNQMTEETLEEIREEIKRIQNSIKTVFVDEGQVAAEEDLAGEPRGDDNERSNNATGQPTTIDAGNAYLGDNSDEDARINTERGGEIAATESEVKEQKLESTISRLHGELKEKEKEIASLRDILRKIGVMVNSEDGDSDNEGGDAPHKHRDRGTKSGDRNQREKELQSEIDSLKEQLKNSRPIETVDLTTNEVKRSTATEDDSNEKEPPSKRQRTKSNLANALEQSQQMVAVKEEAIQRAKTAEASAEAARQEKDAVEASLRDVQEDLEIQQETTEQVAVTLDTWQGRFDRLYELAAASGVDGAMLRSIREGNSA